MPYFVIHTPRELIILGTQTDKRSTPWTFDRRLIRERTILKEKLEVLQSRLNTSKLAQAEIAAENEKLQGTVNLLRREIFLLRTLDEKTWNRGVSPDRRGRHRYTSKRRIVGQHVQHYCG